MTTLIRKQFILTLVGVLAVGVVARGQQSFSPHIGYVYPAGGRQGASIEVKVGGQYLQNVSNASISGAGIQAAVVDFTRPMTPKEANDLRQKLKELQEKRTANQTAWTAADMKMVAEIRQKLFQFQKRSITPAIAETVTLKLTIASNAVPGERELRLRSPQALSDPLLFCVSQLPEFNKPAPAVEQEPVGRFRPRNDNVPKAVAMVESRVVLPCVINGQILPGGVDRYHFQARRGQRLVIAVTARELIPYLADAVPGWFQAAVSLYDSQGHELAYADHFQFHPDPVLYYEIQRDGDYIVQIRDSIYRGREDFVYRITAGELPYITGLFPLGGSADSKTSVKLMGWNLPDDTVTKDDRGFAPGIYPISMLTVAGLSNRRSFAVDDLPECFSRKSNHSQAAAQPLALPVIVNGCIDKPGQWDVFRFDGAAGDEFIAEVIARRLDSALDSVLRLTDADGKQLAFNDDYEDKADGLHTHHADSYLRATLPANGAYYLYLGDAQQQGGPEYAYRLRVGPPQPDFALRIVPTSLTVRGGMSTPVTVYAVRKDGFTNEITLALKNAPAGFILNGGAVPAGKDQVRLTLTAPTFSSGKVFNLSVIGHAWIKEHEVVHPVVPAEDMMQAFAYWHLVPSKDLEVSLSDRPQLMFALKILDPTPIKIPAGGSAQVHVRTPVRAANNFQLELDDPPEGISIANITTGDGETKITLHSDATKIKPGSSGNLIVSITAGRARANRPAGKGKGNQQRIVIGSLPAIPFEIIAPQIVAK